MTAGKTPLSDVAAPYRANRVWLFLPFVIVGLLFAAYAVVWFTAQSKALKALDRWVASEKARGMDAGYERARGAGFPLRFAIEVEGLHLGNPARGTNWTSSRLRLNALPYNPTHVILESLGPLTITYSDKRVWTLNAKVAAASLHWGKAGLLRLSGQASDVSWVANDGAAGRLKAWALQAAPDAKDQSRIQFESEALDGRVPELSPELAAFGQDFATVKVKGHITAAQSFVGGLSPATIDIWSAANGVVQFEDVSMRWGAAQLSGQGQMALDRLRRPAGTIHCIAKDVDAIAQSLVNQGWIKGPAARLFLQAARDTQQREGGLKIDIEGRDGTLSVWGLPVMELQPLYTPTVPDAIASPVAGG